MNTMHHEMAIAFPSRRICRLALACCAGALGMLLSSTTAQADLTIVGQQTAMGASIPIGNLSASVTGGGAESATFTLNAPYRSLMSDANNLQFRFFQAIYYDDEPAKWNGAVIAAAGTAAHTKDVVDVPSGGWDYESASGGGGDDTSPFYESDTANNPSTGNPYKYPGLAYPALHSADGVNPGTMSTNDTPGLSNKNDQTLFDTFLTYENPAMIAAKQVDLLGGYTWGVQTDAAITKTGIDPTYIDYSSENAALLAEFQGALNISGFAAWTAVANDVIIPVPEPTAAALMLAGPLLLSLRRRRC